MAIDVAVLRAKLRFEGEGHQQATQAANQVSRAMEEVGKSAEASSFRVREQADKVLGAVEALQTYRTTLTQAQAALAELGSTDPNAFLPELNKATNEITSLSASLRDLEDQKQGLIDVRAQLESYGNAGANGIKQMTERIAELDDQIAPLAARKEELQALAEELALFMTILQEGGGGEIKILAELEGMTDRLKSMRERAEGAGEGARKAGEQTGFFAQMLGRFNNGAGLTVSNLASMIGRITGLGVVAIIAFRAISKLIRGVVNLARQMIASADSMNLFSDSTQRAAASLGELENFSGAKLLAFIADATNRWRSFGNSAETAQQAALAVAEVANIAQFRNRTPGDADQVANQLQRAVESLSFDSLRSLGFDVGRINEAFRELAEDGISKAAQQEAAWNEIRRQTLAGSREAENQAERERATLAGLRVEFEGMVGAVGASSQMQDAVRNLSKTLREAFPQIKSFLIVLGQGTVVAVKLAVAAIEVLLDSMVGLVRFFAGGIDNPVSNFFIKTLLPGMDTLQEMAGGADNAAAAMRAWADDVEATRAEVGDWQADLDRLVQEFPELEEGLEDVAQDLAKVRQEAAKSSGLASALMGLGQAFQAMSDDLNPRTAITGLSQFSAILDTVINDGVTNLDAFRLRARAALAAGFFNQEQFNEAMRGFDVLEGALDPIIEQAQKLKEEQDQVAAARLEGLTGEFNNVDSAAGQARDTISQINDEIRRIPSEVPVHFKISSSGGMTIGHATDPAHFIPSDEMPRVNGQTFSPSRETPAPVMTAAQREQDRVDQRNLKDAIESAKSANIAPPPRGDQGPFTNLGDVFGSGGGGGGGAGNTLATIEQIREFMQEVNRAIGIASRGGVRIGTAGNAIPFEEGSFLNAQGGGLSVDTILIRGVWDFADPAAKRQIIKELQEALTSLQGEV